MVKFIFLFGPTCASFHLEGTGQKKRGGENERLQSFSSRKSLPPPTNTTPSCRNVKEEEEEEKYSTSPLSYLSRPLPLHTFEAACKKGGGKIKSRNPIPISSPRPAVSFFSQLERGINSDWEGGFFPPVPPLRRKSSPRDTFHMGGKQGKDPARSHPSLSSSIIQKNLSCQREKKA